MKTIARLLVGLLVVSSLTGCATVPYQRGVNIESANTLALRPGEPQFERGRPNALIDGVGWVFGVPSKILLLDSRVDNHNISLSTEEALAVYLAHNDLHHVKVRVNQYAPGREWSRLFRNKAVGAGWRYTIGMLSMLGYTILPGRIFGGDNYNPYTNTINLYSDHPAIALHEGGHAKDFAPRKYKGTYAFFYMLPFATLYAEARATGDAMGYLREMPSAKAERQAFKVLYPAYATYIGGEAGRFTPIPTAIYFAALVPGHILGRIKAGQVTDREPPLSSPAIEP